MSGLQDGAAGGGLLDVLAVRQDLRHVRDWSGLPLLRDRLCRDDVPGVRAQQSSRRVESLARGAGDTRELTIQRLSRGTIKLAIQLQALP